MNLIILSAMGPDQPGIVDQLTDVLGRFKINIADSRMINLSGQFAIVMSLQVPEDQTSQLRKQLPDTAKEMGLNITLAQAPGAPGVTRTMGIPYRIRTYAMDSAGLVHQITHQLHTLQVNIEELETRLEHGPHSGTPLFSMDMIVTIPDIVPLKQVRDELETLCTDLNCDLDIDRA